jgi:hypothetical protein
MRVFPCDQLRAELRQQLLAADVHTLPRWDTFAVTGPQLFEGARGRAWYEYRASVECRERMNWETRP